MILSCLSTATAISPPAGATPQDQAFLHRLDEVGITYTSPYGTTMYARGVCRELDLNVPHSRVVEFVQRDNPAFDWDHAADYVVIAYMTYCPWNKVA
ncbi:hypothetical protein AU194_10230 [Mycobacterium sp. GA-2829]|nr:hypothetical protein AU194_10230 [Mycobacterium sp. GA-2829]